MPPVTTTDRPPLTRQRCWNHAEREAAARCRACARFFCRECITEQAGRMICASCLRAQVNAGRREPPTAGGRGRRLRQIAGTAWRAGQVGAGLLAAWFFFDVFAQFLAALPENFHEGTFWQKALTQENDE